MLDFICPTCGHLNFDSRVCSACTESNAELAASVNHLLVVGFYLVNLGYVALALRTGAALTTPREAIELESQKIGWVLLILGAMHFFNIFVFHRMRQRNQAPRIARATELI